MLVAATQMLVLAAATQVLVLAAATQVLVLAAATQVLVLVAATQVLVLVAGRGAMPLSSYHRPVCRPVDAAPQASAPCVRASTCQSATALAGAR